MGVKNLPEDTMARLLLFAALTLLPAQIPTPGMAGPFGKPEQGPCCGTGGG
jgi:hypothetical protein